MKSIHHLIDGEAVASTSGRTSPVFDPATGAQTGVLGLASVDEVDAAVASAKAAFAEWRDVSIAKRTKLHVRVPQSRRRERRRDRARGSPPSTARSSSDAGGEVARAIENIEYRLRRSPSTSRAATASRPPPASTCYSVRRPLGVVAGITPFNFPAMVPLWMIPNAIACGNTFVLKPSERDPSAPLFIAELFQRGRLPAGCAQRRAAATRSRSTACSSIPT